MNSKSWKNVTLSLVGFSCAANRTPLQMCQIKYANENRKQKRNSLWASNQKMWIRWKISGYNWNEILKQHSQQFILSKMPENRSPFADVRARISAGNLFAYWVASFDCITNFPLFDINISKQPTQRRAGERERGRESWERSTFANLLIFNIILQMQTIKRKKLYPFCVCAILVLFWMWLSFASFSRLYFWRVSCFGFSPQSYPFHLCISDDDDDDDDDCDDISVHLGITWIFFSSIVCFQASSCVLLLVDVALTSTKTYALMTANAAAV